jgi:hypothetical protein
MTKADLAAWFAKRIEAELLAAIAGPPRKQRPTALRLRGNSFETVEIDDAGNVIEPVRCTCGGFIVLHRPSCPFYFCTT